MGYDLKNKIVLITGANRGIGRALVDTFIEQGAAKVYAGVRKVESASPLVEKYGDKVVPVRVDLTDAESIVAAAKTAKDVQVVVNNGGVLTETSALDGKVFESLEYEMGVNVYGLIRMAQAFAPVLKKNGGGVFAQLNSVVSMKTFASIATYSASKAASYAITQALREELGEQGTVVLSVHPGPIDTDMLNQTGFEGMGEPASLVGDAIVGALAAGEFHAYPDTMAKQIGGAYQSFAEEIVLADLTEE